jgi:hypothetical protein
MSRSCSSSSINHNGQRSSAGSDVGDDTKIHSRIPIHTNNDQEKRIRCYEDLGLSSTKMIAFNDAVALVDRDRILEQEFVVDESDWVKVCIYVLYECKYASKMTALRRIKAIKDCITAEWGTRLRLREIAFSDAHDRIARGGEKAFQACFNAASTARMFFSKDNSRKVIGRFPNNDVILQFQTSKNCFLAAVCLWYTLQCRHDLQHNENACKPLDIAQVGRHHLVCDGKSLEQRVVQNRGGGHALDFAKKLAGSFNFEGIEFSTRSEAIEKPRAVTLTCNYLALRGFGLVTDFKVHRQIEASMKWDTGNLEVTVWIPKASTFPCPKMNSAALSVSDFCVCGKNRRNILKTK